MSRPWSASFSGDWRVVGGVQTAAPSCANSAVRILGRRRRECRPYRSWVSDSSFLRLTIGRLSDWGYLAAHVRSDRADGFRREFLEVPSYPQAEEVAQRIRVGEPGTWRELDLTP